VEDLADAATKASKRLCDGRCDGRKPLGKRKLTKHLKLEYVNFLLLVGRHNLTYFYAGVPSATSLVHSMIRTNAPGYTNFEVVFQEIIKPNTRGFETEIPRINSSSAEQLLLDQNLARVWYPLFIQFSEKFEILKHERIFDIITQFFCRVA